MSGFHWSIWVMSAEDTSFNQSKFVWWISLWAACKAEWWALIFMCDLHAVLDIKCGWLSKLQWKWNTVNTTDLFTALWELILPPEASCHLKIHWKYIWHNSSLRYLQAYAKAFPLELLGHARNCVCYGAYWFHSRDITTMTPCDKQWTFLQQLKALSEHILHWPIHMDFMVLSSILILLHTVFCDLWTCINNQVYVLSVAWMWWIHYQQSKECYLQSR